MIITPSQPTSLAWAVSSITSAVRIAPVPPITGIRPATASTARATTRLRSSVVWAQNSPVQPLATTPPTPAAIRYSMTRRKASSSIAPSASKGVTTAVKGPRQSTVVLSMGSPPQIPLVPRLARVFKTAPGPQRKGRRALGRILVPMFDGRRNSRTSASTRRTGSTECGSRNVGVLRGKRTSSHWKQLRQREGPLGSTRESIRAKRRANARGKSTRQPLHLQTISTNLQTGKSPGKDHQRPNLPWVRREATDPGQMHPRLESRSIQ